MYVSCRSAAIRNRLPGYSISFDKKKQYSQSRLQIAPGGLAMTWNATGASGRVSSGLAAVSVASVIAGSVRRRGGQAQHSRFPLRFAVALPAEQVLAVVVDVNALRFAGQCRYRWPRTTRTDSVATSGCPFLFAAPPRT